MEPNSRKRSTLIRPGDGLVIAFFVPVVIMIIIFIQRGIFPFGEESFYGRTCTISMRRSSRNSSISCGPEAVFCTAGMWGWESILRPFMPITWPAP